MCLLAVCASGESSLLWQSEPERKRVLQVSDVLMVLIKSTAEFNTFSGCLVRTPDLRYNFDSNTGRVFHYYSYGVACSEVEIDCLTGAHKVRRGSILEVHLFSNARCFRCEYKCYLTTNYQHCQLGHINLTDNFVIFFYTHGSMSL